MSFRSLLEVLLPLDAGRALADQIAWLGPFVLVGVALFFFKDFVKQNWVICLAIGAVAYLALIYKTANTQYKWDMDDPVADRCDGTFVWLNEANKADEESGKITQEEYSWRKHLLLRVGRNLVLEHAMPASAYVDAGPELRAWFDRRTNDEKVLRDEVEKGEISKWEYRRKIDALDEESFEPWQTYVATRDGEQSNLELLIFLPFLFLVGGFLIFGYVSKPIYLAMTKRATARNSKSWSRVFSHYNFAESTDPLSIVRGSITLAYPMMYVGGVPYELAKCSFDEIDSSVLHTDTVTLRLSSKKGRVHTDPAPQRKKFFFDPTEGSHTKSRPDPQPSGRRRYQDG